MTTPASEGRARAAEDLVRNWLNLFMGPEQEPTPSATLQYVLIDRVAAAVAQAVKERDDWWRITNDAHITVIGDKDAEIARLHRVLEVEQEGHAADRAQAVKEAQARWMLYVGQPGDPTYESLAEQLVRRQALVDGLRGDLDAYRLENATQAEENARLKEEQQNLIDSEAMLEQAVKDRDEENARLRELILTTARGNCVSCERSVPVYPIKGEWTHIDETGRAWCRNSRLRDVSDADLAAALRAPTPAPPAGEDEG